MRLDQLISTSDAILKTQEDKTVKSIQASLDKAFNALEAKTTKLYSKALEDINTSSAFRLQKLTTELGALLELIDPTKAAFYKERLENLILVGQERGLALSQDILQRFESGYASLSIRVDFEAAAFAAQNAVDRLKNHTEAFRQEAIQIIGYNLFVGSGARKTAAQLRAKFDLVKYRAEAIARTETLAALNEAADRTYQQEEVDYVQWFATSDERTCKYCGFRNQRIYKRGEVKVPTHVSCMCFLTPVKPKWLEKGLVDLEWATKYHKEAGEKITGSDPGISPFERSGGLKAAPKSVWNPGEAAPTLTSKAPPSKSPSAFTNFKASDKIKSIDSDLPTWDKEYDVIENVVLYNRQLKKLGTLDPETDKFKDLNDSVDFLRRKIPDNTPYLKADPQTLADNLSIGQSITASLGEKKIGIYDEHGNLQATAIYIIEKKPEDKSKPHIYLDYVATAPWNLIDDARSVKGAGTRAIVEAVELSKAKGFDGRVRLEPLIQAKPFYEKLGFEPDSNDKDAKWELSPQKAQALLEKVAPTRKNEIVKKPPELINAAVKKFATMTGETNLKLIDKDLKIWRKEHEEMEKVLLLDEARTEGASDKEVKEREARIDPSNPYQNVPIQKLKDNFGIGYAIATSPGADKIAVYDDRKNLQATMIYEMREAYDDEETPYLYVELFATAPWNVAQTDKTVKGAGTKAIAEAIKVSRNNGASGRIRLSPIDEAKPFYTKVGFVPEVDDDELADWELAPDKATELLKLIGENE